MSAYNKKKKQLNKIEGWSRDGRVIKYTNKICRDNHIHYTSLLSLLLFLIIMHLLMSCYPSWISECSWLACMWEKMSPMAQDSQLWFSCITLAPHAYSYSKSKHIGMYSAMDVIIPTLILFVIVFFFWSKSCHPYFILQFHSYFFLFFFFYCSQCNS